MSSSDSSYVVRIMEGDLLKSGAQTLVNTVNTVGAVSYTHLTLPTIYSV